jgi:EmrB/QacA subfamily drug resistance transporter
VEGRHTNILLALLFVGVLMGALDIAIIGPALPAIQAEFDMSSRQLATLFNAYVLCQMIGAQLLAKLSDRVGLRAVYLFGIGCFALGSLLLAFAPDIYTLYTGRSVQGFGAGGIFPVASAVIAARLPMERRGPALGILGTVWGIAFLIGPILGGIFLRFSWQWLFLVNLPIAALLMIGAVRLLPGERPQKRAPFDLPGTLMLVVGLTALVVGINQIDTSSIMASIFSWQVMPLLAVFAVLAPVFWRREQQAVDPIIRPGLLENRQARTACIIAAGTGAMQSASVFLPTLVVAAIGLTAANAALLLLPGVVMSTLASPVVGRLINVVGTRVLVLTSLVLVTSSFLLLSESHLSLPVIVMANVVSGLGTAGLVGAPLRFIMLAEARPEERGSAQGLLSVCTSMGRLIGAAVVGSVAASRGGAIAGYQSAFAGMAFLAVTLFLVAMLLKSRAREQPDTAGLPASA